MLEEQLAQSVQTASVQRTSFEERLAQSELSLSQAGHDACEMRASYEQGALIASKVAEEKQKISVEV